MDDEGASETVDPSCYLGKCEAINLSECIFE